MPASWDPPDPRPSAAEAMPTATLVAICCDTRSRPCSRSACAISCPMIAASSSSVSFSLSISAVYTAILPPGMHQALSWFEVITCTSHCQPGASLRKAPVWTISRFAIVRTRCTWAGSWSSWPFCRAWPIVFAYSWDAALSTSADDTSIAWDRSTPTAPPWVVLTVLQPPSAPAAIEPARANARIRARIVISGRLCGGVRRRLPEEFRSGGKQKQPAGGGGARRGERPRRAGQFPGEAAPERAEEAADAVSDRHVERLAPDLARTGEPAVDQRHRRHVARAERRGVRNLRGDQEPEAAHAPADHGKPHQREREAREEHLVGAEALHPPRRGEEDRDLGDDAERPQRADQRLAVARAVEIDAVEGVQRSVRDVHQQIRTKERDHLRAQRVGEE